MRCQSQKINQESIENTGAIPSPAPSPETKVPYFKSLVSAAADTEFDSMGPEDCVENLSRNLETGSEALDDEAVQVAEIVDIEDAVVC